MLKKISDEQMEELLIALREKLLKAEYFEVCHEYGLDLKINDKKVALINNIDNLYYDGRETYIIKINHTKSVKSSLNEGLSKKNKVNKSKKIIDDAIKNKLL